MDTEIVFLLLTELVFFSKIMLEGEIQQWGGKSCVFFERWETERDWSTVIVIVAIGSCFSFGIKRSILFSFLLLENDALITLHCLFSMVVLMILFTSFTVPPPPILCVEEVRINAYTVHSHWHNDITVLVYLNKQCDVSN